MLLNTPSSPHFHSPTTVSTVMMRVVYALLPAVLIYAYLFGWGVIVNIVIATATAIISEAIILKIRKKPMILFLTDGSALVTGLLLGLALPPLSPWWLLVVGAAFAIIFAKHLYGGLGYNPFNPAMVGYVMLLISFPKEMTTWAAPLTLSGQELSLGNTLALVFGGTLPAGMQLDALTMATPLDTLKTQLSLGQQAGPVMQNTPVFGYMGGVSWEWVNLALLGGGLWLIYKKVISWHVPTAMLGSIAVLSLLFYVISPESYAPPQFHIFTGAAILGAFFIATDPVSGATSLKGRLIFGAGVGVLTFVIRTWGGFPDAVAFSVLLMNMAAPTIDYYTRPRVFGKEVE